MILKIVSKDNYLLINLKKGKLIHSKNIVKRPCKKRDMLPRNTFKKRLKVRLERLIFWSTKAKNVLWCMTRNSKWTV